MNIHSNFILLRELLIMKTYVVKTYNLNWTYKETINPDHIINELSFSWSMNWWLWQLQIQTDYKFADTSYKGWEYVKVFLFDEFHDKDNWKQIYYGFISKIQRKAEESIREIKRWKQRLFNAHMRQFATNVHISMHNMNAWLCAEGKIRLSWL